MLWFLDVGWNGSAVAPAPAGAQTQVKARPPGQQRRISYIHFPARRQAVAVAAARHAQLLQAQQPGGVSGAASLPAAPPTEEKTLSVSVS
ncbi:MAG: hypothetical protein PHD19_00335 [Dechloromonas sp.]|nr:hypothetical protein [Dechloromonas sp.]